jgi:transposase
MTDRPDQHGCPNCAKLEAKLAKLEAELAKLKAEMAMLQSELAKARKNSANSSKPPSSDIVNPSPKGGKRGRRSKRKRGGQPGHTRHQRAPFPPDEIDLTWIHYYTGCPCCGGNLEDTDEAAKVLQQVEIKNVPMQVAEHLRRTQRCVECGKHHLIPWPEDLKKAGLVGPRLTTLIAYVKSTCHMSFSSIRKFLRDVVGVTISRGQLRKVVAKVSESLHEPYEQLLALLQNEDRLNVDETGHKENGQRLWTWCFRASLYTVFKISPSRGSDVLLEVLGKEFDGVLGCDYFGAYRKYMRLTENVVLQFCLAHFIRDVKFLVKHPNKKNRDYGSRLLDQLRKLFHVIHRRDEYSTEKRFQSALTRIRDDLVYHATMNSPATREAKNLGDRFLKHEESFFTFISTPGIEPTNNLAEQAIRFVAIHRRLTQGTRSRAGQIWCERIWTAIATCTQQGRSVFEYIEDAVRACFRGKRAPSLIPDTS